MSPMRRDGEGRPQIGPDWESLIERQIREAAEAGAFDDLPHQGERLPLEDDSLAGSGRWPIGCCERRDRAALDRVRQGGQGATR